MLELHITNFSCEREIIHKSLGRRVAQYLLFQQTFILMPFFLHHEVPCMQYSSQESIGLDNSPLPPFPRVPTLQQRIRIPCQGMDVQLVQLHSRVCAKASSLFRTIITSF